MEKVKIECILVKQSETNEILRRNNMANMRMHRTQRVDKHNIIQYAHRWRRTTLKPNTYNITKQKLSIIHLKIKQNGKQRKKKKQEEPNLKLEAWLDENDEGLIIEVSVKQLKVPQVLVIAQSLIERALQQMED